MWLFMAVQKAGLVGGAPFSQRLEGRDLRTVAQVLKSECMLVFTLLLLLVEGLEGFAALGFDVVVMLVLIAIVVQRSLAHPILDIPDIDPRTPRIDSAHIPTMSDQQSATCNCPIKGCRNSLPPKDSHRTCLEHREKGRQHKKKVRASMKCTRDNAELSDAFTEVLWTPLEHIGPTRMCRENTCWAGKLYVNTQLI